MSTPTPYRTMYPTFQPTMGPTEPPKKEEEKVSVGQIILYIFLGIAGVALIYVGGSFAFGIGDDKDSEIKRRFRSYKFRY
jgi:hypothetical protein